MNVYGQLNRAQLEFVTGSNPTAVLPGRIWWNSTDSKYYLHDGTLIRAMLRNDQQLVIGNHATASNNLRLNRSAAAVLQVVSGDNVTAEGSSATSLAQISARVENFTFAGLPAFGNQGRLAYATDQQKGYLDTGTAWTPLSPTGNSVYDIIIGSAAEVTAGRATHSTWTAGIAAASAGQAIRGLPGTWVENVTVTKQVQIEGSGYGTYINGSLTLNSSADNCAIEALRVNDDITLNTGADGNFISKVFLPSGKTFIDNGTGNLLEGMQA